ncbi:hypothetical protein SynA1562_00853 [Synechococcus sp. A15-62]|nr:hypothetical protein SynA1562_00853 [Synechococcus sp. A15-62]
MELDISWTGNTNALRCLAHQRRCLGELDLSSTILSKQRLSNHWKRCERREQLTQSTDGRAMNS